MATVIGGAGTGLLDSSLYLLNRNDNTRDGQAGHGEEVYVNVSNGNLVIRHVDAYLPSQGEDYALVRTYNSRGSWNSEVGKGWTLTSFLELSPVTNNQIILINPDSSQFVFTYDSASGNYRSVDGVGAYEEIVYDKTAKTYTLVRANQTRLFFDINGTRVRSQDPAGNVMNYSYSGGKLVSIQDDTQTAHRHRPASKKPSAPGAAAEARSAQSHTGARAREAYERRGQALATGGDGQRHRSASPRRRRAQRGARRPCAA